jgi:TonB family protein
MNARKPIPFLIVLLVTSACCSSTILATSMTHAAPPDPSLQESVLTGFSLLIGYPSSENSDTKGMLIVPGVVIPIHSAKSPGLVDVAEYLKRTSADITDISGKLKRTLRLEKIALHQQTVKSLFLGETKNTGIVLPESELTITAELTGCSDEMATFRIRFEEPDQELVDTHVSIPMGNRSVIGGMNGDSVPYYFLIVEPVSNQISDLMDGETIYPPKLIEYTKPVYPDSCRKEGLQGIVILETRIDETGHVTGATVIETPDPELANSAVAAVKQWLFEPAILDSDPVEVIYVLTVKFRLE